MSKKDSLSHIRYEGGDGSSREKAVIICGARHEEDGVAAEYAYIRKRFAGVVFLEQELIEQGGRYYDKLVLDTGRGQQRLWFDCTDFFRRHSPEILEAMQPAVERWLREVRGEQQQDGQA